MCSFPLEKTLGRQNCSLGKKQNQNQKTHKQPGHEHKKDIIEEHQFIDNNEKMPYYFLPIMLNIIIKKQTYFHITCETAK